MCFWRQCCSVRAQDKVTYLASTAMDKNQRPQSRGSRGPRGNVLLETLTLPPYDTPENVDVEFVCTVDQLDSLQASLEAMVRAALQLSGDISETTIQEKKASTRVTSAALQQSGGVISETTTEENKASTRVTSATSGAPASKRPASASPSCCPLPLLEF